jgi:hypothetical protein
MKFLKTKNISKFSVSDRTLIVNPYGRIVTNSKNSLQIPVGNDDQRPQDSLATEGQMRINTQVLGVGYGEFEVYQAGAWRNVKFKVPSAVTYSTPGIGDGVETLFGPLSPTPPASIENGAPWTGAQLMVYVENVFQLFGSNYTITQNPCNVHGTIISFTNPHTITSSNTNTITGINFLERGFHTGQTITVSGSTSNNGNLTVTGVTASTIVVSQTINTALAGPDVTIVGKSTLTNLAYPTGYYLTFGTPVPAPGAGSNGVVTVITGFDK